MALDGTTTFANPDPSANPLTLTQLIAILNALVSTVIPGDYAPYVISSSTPAVDDQDKVWHKTDSAGRPLGTFLYYSGAWRREQNGRTGDVKLYSGNPGTDFDSTGLGIVGGNQDGWALLNGSNGMVDISNLFVVAADMDNLGTGYNSGAGGWRSIITGAALSTGGASQITLNAANTYSPAVVAAGLFDHWKADGNTRSTSDGLWGNPDVSGGGSDATIVPASAGNPTPPPIQTIPPFYSLAYVGWVGYA